MTTIFEVSQIPSPVPNPPAPTPPVQNPRPAQTPRSVGVTRRPLTLPTLFPGKIDTSAIKRQADSFTISTIHPSGQESRKRYFHFTMLPALSSEVSFSNASIFKKTHQVPEARPGIPIVTKMHHRNIVIPGCHNVIQTLGLERKYMTLVGAFMPTDHFTTRPSKSTSRYKTSQQAAQGFESIVVFGLTRIEIDITVNTSANHTEKIELTGSVVEFKTYSVYQNLSYYSITLLVDSDLWQQRPAQEETWNVLPPQVSEKRNTNVGTEISRAGAGAEAGGQSSSDSGQQREQVASNPILDIILGGRAEAATPPNQNNPNAPNTSDPNDPSDSVIAIELPGTFTGVRILTTDDIINEFYSFTVSSIIPEDFRLLETGSWFAVKEVVEYSSITGDTGLDIDRSVAFIWEFINGVITRLEQDLEYMINSYSNQEINPTGKRPDFLSSWVKQKDVGDLSITSTNYPPPNPTSTFRIDIKENTFLGKVLGIEMPNNPRWRYKRHLVINIFPPVSNKLTTYEDYDSAQQEEARTIKEVPVSVAVVNLRENKFYGYIVTNNPNVEVNDTESNPLTIEGKGWETFFSRDISSIEETIFNILADSLNIIDEALINKVTAKLNEIGHSGTYKFYKSNRPGSFILQYSQSPNSQSPIALRFTKDRLGSEAEEYKNYQYSVENNTESN